MAHGITAGGVAKPLLVNTDGTVNVTGGGGGTEYTEGDTDASLTGGVIMMEGAANTVVPVQGTAADGLLVNLGANNDVSGTVTANLSATDNAVLDAIAASLAGTLTVTGGGGGTEYTEDAAAAANPVGASLILIREDGRAGSLTTTDGDNVAARGNNKGEMYVKTTDSDAILTTMDVDTGAIATSAASIDTKTPALGQALAASSVPVVLTAAQVTTLTPPAAIAGFALETTLGSVKTAVETIDNAISGSEMQVDVVTMPTVTVASHAVTNAGTFAVQVDGAALTSLQLQDDTVATLGTTTYTEASTKGTTIGAVRRDADTTLVDATNEIGPLQMDANGRLKVEAFSGEALPVTLTSTTVTGTVAVTQSGTWDEVGINDSGNSITVDYATTGSGTATGAIRVELPTNGTGVLATVGAVTAITNALPAGTNAIGKLAANSGVDIGDVDILSLIPGTGATNLGKAMSSTKGATDTGVAVYGIRDDSLSIFSDAEGDYEPFHMTATGRLYTSSTVDAALPAGTNNIGDVDIISGTITTVSALGTGTTGPQKAEDVASAAGDTGVAIMAARLDTPVANAGVSNDGDYTTPVLDNFRKLWVTGTVLEDTAHVAGEAIIQGGVRRIDTAATSAGTSGDWATMDASAEGAVWATLTPTTTSGCTIFRSIDLDESEEEIKATAGNIYGYIFSNTVASIRYLKFYNATAANVTVGSTTPVITIALPASSSGHVSFPYPIGFGTAITAAVTTGVADADTGAPGANDCILNVFYK